MECVSIVVPILNEEAYIKQFLTAVSAQDYPHNALELLLVDGCSTDQTRTLIYQSMENSDISFKVLNNPKKITPVALNIGIKESRYNYIVRLDAHSIYPKNYISKCISYLKSTNADNVGCILKTAYHNNKEKMIASMLSSKFGVGNSGFRTNAKSGYVDTVPFGTFRKELFQRIGLFDERLSRNQDSEFNSRIIKSGGKIYLFDDIEITYYPRNTVKKLLAMGKKNGSWNIYTAHLCPGSMRLRHFIPFGFVLSQLIGIISIIARWQIITFLFIGELALYLLLDLIFSIKSSDSLKDTLVLLFLFPSFHIAYGIGSFQGLIKCLFSRKKAYQLEYLT